eukprot:9493174-Pyramimonas_sp.AAC.1
MIVWNRSSATPARAHMRHQLLEWWHSASTLLVRYQSIRRRGATAESVSLSKKFNELLQAALDNELQKPFAQDADGVFASRTAAVANLDKQGEREISELIQISERFLNRAVSKAQSDGRRAFGKWALKMWRDTPGALHRHVKPPAI